MKLGLPKVAIVGRPNVGKSALFNRLCGQRKAIVDEMEGVTRDRIYAEADFFGRECLLIDTGGIDARSKHPFHDEVCQQAKLAMIEADLIVLVVDGKVGPTLLDHEVSTLLQKQKKPVILAVNKIDTLDEAVALHQFHSLSFPRMVGVSAMQGLQIAELMETISAFFPEREVEAPRAFAASIAIVGRTNVGKSTLLNTLMGMERSIVSPVAGTTRDSIDSEIHIDGRDFLLIDTAGIRRKCVERDVVEKFAAVRTKEALERADVVFLMLDAEGGMTTQDKRIASDIETLGKSCILIFNKWDLVHGFRKEHVLRAVREAVPFLNHCPTLFLSAKSPKQTQKIWPLVYEVIQDREQRITTGQLNKFIERCVQKYHPPMLTGKRLRIYYMTQVAVAPPRFVLFVNRPDLMTQPYEKYILNQFREEFRFSGSPIFLSLRGKAASAPIEDFDQSKIGL